MKKILVLLATLGAISGAVQAQAPIKVLSTQELVNTCKLPASPESRSFALATPAQFTIPILQHVTHKALDLLFA